jgi:Uma2 family endonuclease
MLAAMNAAPVKKWTPEEYLRAERSASQKHAYFGGEIFAMAGCTERHDTITANVTTALGNALRGGPCRPHTSDMRIHIPATGLYTYSDGLVVCGAQFTDQTRDTLINPAVIFEVLSDSTEGYDRGRKFDNYRSIPSLMDYVLVSQDEVLVEHFVRQEDGTWNLRVLRTEQRLRLTGVAIEIPVEDLYLWAFDK